METQTNEAPVEAQVKDPPVEAAADDWGKPSSASWAPEVNEVITGKVLSLSESGGSFSSPSLRLEAGSGSTKVWAGTVLWGLVIEMGVSVGDTISIKYFGKDTGKNGQTFNVHDLRIVERALKDDIPF